MRLDRRPIRIWALTAIVVLLAGPQADADQWGHKLSDLPTQFIFGYGSLIDGGSREKTAGAPLDAIPVRVSADFGYIRAWVDRCPCGFTALGLRRRRAGEAPMTINGVIYPVDSSSLPAFDLREAKYRRVLVPRVMIEAISWQGLPETGNVWAYIPDGPGGEPGVDLPDPSARFPIVQSYVDLVLHGALRYGSDFATEFIETTADWSVFWLNDREIPRRPWVHSTDYQVIDSLLSKVAPASDHLADRLLSEEFTARFLPSLASPNH